MLIRVFRKNRLIVDDHKSYRYLFGFFRGIRKDRREEIRLFQKVVPNKCLSNYIIEEHILKDGRMT